ncbi:hypothetical protein KC207_13315 [Phycicoccus sp. BSK3Z-2]|uniref:Alkaline phosphatase family protein n=1 Tax=Phycicoccus avicenniae TaxID=2828860 RepID=A0A941D998_9MICO|nr:hypothetical protein [Phycicoccus avicenniae]MBR7744268.1 hypothetical protein [Phycicoccus avicenniae]
MTHRALAVALAFLATLGGVGVAVLGSGQARADDVPGAVVVVGTGGISWSDVSQETTPNLWLMLRDGSSAALAARSVYDNTCPADGWLGLSAGSRAAAPRDGEAPDPADRPCPGAPSVVDDAIPSWPSYLEHAEQQRFDTRLGLLAEEVDGAGLCLQGVGRYAAAGAALPDGTVDRWAPLDTDDLLVALNGCPVTLVDVGVVRDPDDTTSGDFVSASREDQLRAVDARIGEVLAAGPNGADYLVASLADAGRTERLRMVLARGPGFGPGTLESRSTRQVGLVQSPDLTATVLDAVGLEVPAEATGTPLTSQPAADNSQARADERLQTLRDLDEASHDVNDLVEPFFQVFAYGQLLVYVLVLLVWKGRLGAESTRTTVVSRVRALSVLAASVPASTFLANLVPWWRFPVEIVAVTAVVGGFAALVATLALRGPWARSPLGPPAFVAAVTMGVLAVDVVTGSRLQLSSLMGLQPVVAGRFYGMSNPTFALFATAALLLATTVSSVLVRRGLRTAAAVAVAVIGAVAVVVNGAPWWGADGGGPPALVPGVVLLVVAVLGIRMTWRRWALVAASVVGLFLAVSIGDWLREPSSRSHLGRFVQSVLDGTADDVVVRKAEQNYRLLVDGAPLSLLVPVALVVLVVVLARPSSWGSRALARAQEQAPTLRAGLVALVLTLTIGFAINDSGVAIPAVGATLAVPLLVSLTLAVVLREAQDGSSTRRGRRGRPA